MDHSFSFITSLQYQLKAALAQLAAFQSGKKYQEMHRKEVLSLKGKTDPGRTAPDPPGHGPHP